MSAIQPMSNATETAGAPTATIKVYMKCSGFIRSLFPNWRASAAMTKVEVTNTALVGNLGAVKSTVCVSSQTCIALNCANVWIGNGLIESVRTAKLQAAAQSNNLAASRA